MNKVVAIMVLAFTSVAVCAGYLDGYKRITSRTVAGDKIIYHYRQGDEVGVYTQTIKRVIGRLQPTKISKLKLIVALKQMNKWEAAKAFIAAQGLDDEWMACQYITTDYPAFASATNGIVQAGIATSQEIEQLLQSARDEE